MEHDYQALRSGTGRWSDTLEGATARELVGARDLFGEARRTANSSDTRRRDRRAATRSLDSLTAAVDATERRWQEIGQPVADQIQRAITMARRDIDRLESGQLIQRLDRLQALERGPDLEVGIDL